MVVPDFGFGIPDWDGGLANALRSSATVVELDDCLIVEGSIG